MKLLVKIAFIIWAMLLLQSNAKAQSNESNLQAAILQGKLELVEALIKDGADLNKKDPYGSTPLIVAATFGKTEAALALIQAGADLTISNNQGSTPLHIAAFFCYPNIVQALLNNGANKHLRNNNGATAYDIVAVPVAMDQEIYQQLQAALGPLGLQIDLNHIESMRPQIAVLLHSQGSGEKEVNFTPIKRSDWNVSNPTSTGIDTNLLEALYEDASHLSTLYSLLVLKDGHLIGEAYFNEGSITQLSKRASVTKSYMSALMGIAIEKGYIEGIDKRMIDFFPEIRDSISDPRKKSITIAQMLQMRAGYPWEETKDAYWKTLWTGKYIHAIEDIPLTHDPGSTFQYSNLTSNWLAMIIARSCKTDLKSFGEKHLFKPLDVHVGDWNKDLDGYYIGSGDIEFTARDMAKFGLLYLEEGNLNGRQIVPADWVKASTQKYSTNINTVGLKSGRLGRYFEQVGYGYQWWSGQVGEHSFHFAYGHGGQLIVLLNDLNMVIVTTADPFYGKEAHFNAWKHEQSVINLVGKFIQSLPQHRVSKN